MGPYRIFINSPSGTLDLQLDAALAEAVKLSVLDRALRELSMQDYDLPEYSIHADADSFSGSLADTIDEAASTFLAAEQKTPPAMGETGEAPKAVETASTSLTEAVEKPHRKRRAGFRCVNEVKLALPGLLPGLRESAMSIARVTALVNAGRVILDKSDVSEGTVDRALHFLLIEGVVVREPGIAKGAGPKAFGWYLTPMGDTMTRPPRYSEEQEAPYGDGPSTVSTPQVKVDRGGFQVTLEAGAGVVSGSVF